MEDLPTWLKPTNSHLFPTYNKKRLCSLLKNEIYIFMISRKTEEDFFDLETFRRSYVSDFNLAEVRTVLNNILEELEKLGWKIQLSYGNTGLFIFSSENPPKNCW